MEELQMCGEIAKKIAESDFVGRLGIVVKFDRGSNAIVLQGSTHSFYQKQMAGEIAMGLIKKTSFCLLNKLSVR